MKEKELYDVGVLVARFQVPELHDAHRSLIEYVLSHHGKVLIVLGIAPVLNTQNNPLDYSARRQMVLEAYPNVDVAYIKDMGEEYDAQWSTRLDQVIGHFVTPRQTAVIYGGRDSFISHYSGRYATSELVQESWVSGSVIRDQIARSATIASPEFRAGVIWAAYSRFPTSYQTVDIAVFNEDWTRLLLGRKDYERLYRFIGGFVDAKTHSLEQNARREVHEEAGIEITDPQYMGSYLIDDWRYRNEVDGIITALFASKYQQGKPTPGDDIAEVRWFDLDVLTPDDVVIPHHELLSKAISFGKGMQSYAQDTHERVKT